MLDFFKENKWQLASLACILAFLYAFGVQGPMFYDDINWIAANPTVHSLTLANIQFIFTHDSLAGMGLASNYYRPLMFVTFLFNFIISGTDPVPYHVVNDLIHLADGVLIYYLLLRWLGSKRVAFLAALFFLIHPLQPEAVSYIAGRGDPMSIFFILGGILLYINRRPWLAGVAMILAVLTRETGVLFPAYLGVALMAFELKDFFWGRLKTAFIRVLPYIGIAAAYGVLRLTVFDFYNTLNFYPEANPYTEHIIYRIYTFFEALTVYVRLIFLPTGLHFDRTIPVSAHLYSHGAWLGAMLILAGIGWLFWLYRKQNWPAFNVWFFGLGIVAVGLSMTSGIAALINAMIYEHWLYFPLFGVFTIVAWYIDRAWLYLEAHRPKLKGLLAAGVAAYCLFLGYQTIQRNVIWANEEAFYENVLQYEPRDSKVLSNFGQWYYAHRDDDDAVRMFQRAIEVNPSNPIDYSSLGVIAIDIGKNDEAEHLFKEALAIDPHYPYAYKNLSYLYVQEGRFTDALRVLEALQAIYPTLDTSSFIHDIHSILESSTTPSTGKL